MGDIGDYWNEHKEYRKNRKQEQRRLGYSAFEILAKSGIPFTELSEEHIRVDGRYDWWPSTGYWKSLDGKKRGHNIRPLLKELKS